MSTASICREDVIAALHEHPEWLTEHIEEIHPKALIHCPQGTSSLVLHQQVRLKQQVDRLHQQLQALCAEAQRNQDLVEGFNALYVRLLSCQEFAEVKLELQRFFQQEMGHAYVECIDQATLDEAGVLPQINERLFANQAIYMGRLNKLTGNLFFGQHQTQPQSVAIVQVASQPGFFIAIGSNDGQHFDPQMDTSLMSQVKRFIEALLQRLNGGSN